MGSCEALCTLSIPPLGESVVVLQHPSQNLPDEIQAIGLEMRDLAGRYDALFSVAGQRFQAVADAAPDMTQAASAVLQALADASLAIATWLPNQPKPACAAGCSACCHLFVSVPPGLAPLMARHVDETFTQEDRAGLVRRLEDAVAAQRVAPDLLSLRHPCPMLGPGGGCSVYEARPIACRAFTSVSADRCRDVVFSTPARGGVDQNPAQYRLHGEATAALERAAQGRGLPSAQRGLCEALLDALSSPALSKPG